MSRDAMSSPQVFATTQEIRDLLLEAISLLCNYGDLQSFLPKCASTHIG
jgi:hypothetical protein